MGWREEGAQGKEGEESGCFLTSLLTDRNAPCDSDMHLKSAFSQHVRTMLTI